MEKLNIISGENKIILNKQECINLELKFNVSKYGKQWSYIEMVILLLHTHNDKDIDIMYFKSNLMSFHL